MQDVLRLKLNYGVSERKSSECKTDTAARDHKAGVEEEQAVNINDL